MKKKKTHWGRKLISLLLLALLCIGTTELIACRLANPELFYKITQSTVALTQHLTESGKEWVIQTAISLSVEGTADSRKPVRDSGPTEKNVARESSVSP